jgi:hypothetical protein
MFALFGVLQLLGILRSPLVHEIIGLDYAECGKPFPDFLTSKKEEILAPTMETETEE